MPPARKTTSPPAIAAPLAITPGEQRIELQLEGFRSVVSGGFLALGKSILGLDKRLDAANAKHDAANALLERIAFALEEQNKLLARQTNGHHVTEERETDHG